MPDIPITDIHTLFGALPASDLDTTLAALLAAMRCQGVAQALAYSLTAVQFDAAAGNDETWQTHLAHPQLHPVAVVDPRRWVGCEDEIARRGAQGFVAFRFFPQRQGWPIDGLPFRKLLRAVERTGKPVIVTSGAAGDPTRLWQAARDLTVPVVISGVGYAVLGEALAVIQETPHFYLEMHTVTQPFQVELAIEAVGVERLLFGSMAPAQYIRPSLKMIECAEITAAEKALILGGNARRLFALPEPEVMP